MKNNFNKNVSLIGVPIDMGASQLGTRLGPEAIRLSGLVERLEDIDYNIEDLGDMKVPNLYTIKKSPDNLNNLDIVRETNEELCNIVDEVLSRDRLPLILGGDHSIVLGSVKGLLKHYENPGIIYFDAHGDINTDKTSLTGNIHGMPIASLMGLGDERLSSVGDSNLKLKPENIVYIGLRDLDPGERKAIKSMGIKAFTMEDIDSLGIADVMKEAIQYISKGTDAIHISFDIDCLDPKVAPGTGVKVLGGLNFREAKIAMDMVSKTEKIRSIEFVEVNPLLDDQNETAHVATALICALFGESQL